MKAGALNNGDDRACIQQHNVITIKHQETGDRKQKPEGCLMRPAQEQNQSFLPAEPQRKQFIDSRLRGNDKKCWRHVFLVTPLRGGTRKDWELSRSFLRRQESRSAGDGVVAHIRACAGMIEEGSVLWLLSPVLWYVGQCPTYTMVLRIDDDC